MNECLIDLNTNNSLVDLFDSTNNDYSKEILKNIFLDNNISFSSVCDRQNILRAMAKNWNSICEYNYSKHQYIEVKNFINSVYDFKINNDNVFFKIFKKKNEIEESRRRSNVIQLITFMNNLHVFIKKNNNINDFPIEFKDEITNSLIFIDKLRLNYYTDIINANKFKISDSDDVINLIFKLGEKEMASFWNFINKLEVYWSITRSIKKYNLVFPSFKQDQFIIDDFFHPMIKNPIKNSIDLSNCKVMLLNGPNMSGKSTLLKAVGLCVFLSRIGLAVPASHCVVPFFDFIAVHINTKDNIIDGYSHFMLEVKNIKDLIIRINNGQTCFVIFDELFNGTNVDDATDIMKLIISGLSRKQGITSIISTHLLSLEGYNIEKNIGIENGFLDCEINNNIPKFSYKLVRGWSKLKIGKLLFYNEGIMNLL